ncbi:MAG: hypothetical protein V3S26_01230 [Acidimicrobiia bacterium]
MARKMLGVFTAVAAAMLLVGVAWAGTGEELSSTEATVATVPDEDTTSTSIDDDDDTTTSTSIPGVTTSTSIDDDDDEEMLDDQRLDYDIPGVGSITIEIVGGRLELVNISAPGWDIDIERAEADRVKVEFERGSDEVEFEARIDHGRVKIEIELESS